MGAQSVVKIASSHQSNGDLQHISSKYDGILLDRHFFECIKKLHYVLESSI
jgi:hypothetical protein